MMSDSRRYGENDRRRQVIPGYRSMIIGKLMISRDETGGEKRVKRIDQEFDMNDGSSGISMDNKKRTCIPLN